jgi:hypothetical protein
MQFKKEEIQKLTIGLELLKKIVNLKGETLTPNGVSSIIKFDSVIEKQKILDKKMEDIFANFKDEEICLAAFVGSFGRDRNFERANELLVSTTESKEFLTLKVASSLAEFCINIQKILAEQNNDDAA